MRAQTTDPHVQVQLLTEDSPRWLGIGDVIYLRLFRTPTLVLNSLESARELLDKRSAKYSDRPRMVLLAEL